MSNVHHVIDTPGPPSPWRTLRRFCGTWALLILGAACSGPARPQTEPQVIRLSTGLPGAFFNPLGAALLGVTGAILAVPVAAAIMLVVREVIMPMQERS